MCLSCKHVGVCEVFVMCGGFFMFCFFFFAFFNSPFSGYNTGKPGDSQHFKFQRLK